MKKILIIVLCLGIVVQVYSKGLRINRPAPDIVQTNIEGDTIQLSSLKGKMVLVDFWASWCAPCRKEHPILIDTYEKYKETAFKAGDGFTIFSVSLDNNNIAWKKAIEKDQLPWPFHVSDLKGWKNDAALLYNISVIPTNYLIDGDGKIVAVNLRGKQLEQKLNKLQKSNSFWKRILE